MPQFPPIRRVLILNGPNVEFLNPELSERCREWARSVGVDVDVFSTNHEGELIDRLHSAPGSFDAVVINPGALAYSSYALADAIDLIDLPTVEVHTSNARLRDEGRRRSVTEQACVLAITGRGFAGYDWALRHLAFGAAMAWEEISYGPEPDQVADLRRPPISGSHPVVVVLHGGFWEDPWRRDLMDGLSVAITARGYATWNLEYRRLGPHGGWPTTLLDVAAGVDQLQGIDDLDLDRVSIVGHSAGGQLALWAAARGGLEDGAPGARPSIGPARVVALAAVSDLEEAEATGVGNRAVAAFLRGPADHRDKYRLASPIERLPLGVPQLIVHGELDEWVPVEMSRRYVDRARKAGDSVTYLELPDCDHMSLIDPSSAAWERVAEHL